MIKLLFSNITKPVSLHIILGCLYIITLISCKPKVNFENKPNILIIVADDLGWNDVSFHGSDIKTPGIDQLASEGIRLNRFYTCPVCTPTRAGLMTGKYPNRFGLRYKVVSPRSVNGLPTEETTLPEFLETIGYKHRAVFGKWHLGHSNIKYHPLNQGFTYFYGHYNGAIDYFTHKRDAEVDWHRNYDPVFEEGYSTDLIGKDVVRYISKVKNNGPFLAYVAFNAPHSPMQAKEDELLEYGYDPALRPKNFPVGGQQKGEREKEIYGQQGRGNNLRQTYSAMVSSMDKEIGSIINHLKENKLYDNTIIWFLSDNGGSHTYGGNNDPLRGYKHSEWEGGVRTVSIVKPLSNTKIEEINQVVSYIDIFPTLVAMTGEIADNIAFDGLDISAVFRGETLNERCIFLGNDVVVSDQWKLINDMLIKINTDTSELTDVKNLYPEKYDELNVILKSFKKIETGGYSYQPEGWTPPKNWNIKQE